MSNRMPSPDRSRIAGFDPQIQPVLPSEPLPLLPPDCLCLDAIRQAFRQPVDWQVTNSVESQALEGELVEDANGFMQPITAFPEDVQASIRAGVIPWPKFVPVVGVNATAPIMPPTADGTIPAAPGT